VGEQLVGDQKDFQQRMQKIGGLVRDLETIADPASRAAAKELVQLLMDLHGAGLERILEIVFESGDSGAHAIDQLGRDPVVSSLLVLYGIHPEDLQTRVERKLHEIVSKLHKMGAEARLVSLNEGEVRVHAAVNSHSCGSTARSVRTTIEEEIYDAAPDLTSLVIEGLEEPAPSGFVGVEKLLGASASPIHQSALQQPTANLVMALNSEGMD
jgi:hypothetical protein